MGKITFWYCDLCEKEVEPSKKPMDSFQKTIWAMIIICSLGFGLIALFLYNKSRKSKYCSERHDRKRHVKTTDQKSL